MLVLSPAVCMYFFHFVSQMVFQTVASKQFRRKLEHTSCFSVSVQSERRGKKRLTRLYVIYDQHCSRTNPPNKQTFTNKFRLFYRERSNYVTDQHDSQPVGERHQRGANAARDKIVTFLLNVLLEVRESRSRSTRYPPPPTTN